MTIIGQRSLCRADGSIHVVASHFIGDSASRQEKGGPSLPENLYAVFGEAAVRRYNRQFIRNRLSNQQTIKRIPVVKQLP